MIIPQNPVLKSRQPLSWQAGVYAAPAIYGVANYPATAGHVADITVVVGDEYATPIPLALTGAETNLADILTTLNTALNTALSTTALVFFTAEDSSIGLGAGAKVIKFVDALTGKYVAVTGSSAYNYMGFPVVASNGLTFAQALGIADYATTGLAGMETMDLQVGAGKPVVTLTAPVIAPAATAADDLALDLNAQMNTGNGTTGLVYFSVIPNPGDNTLLLVDPTTADPTQTVVNIYNTALTMPGFTSNQRTYTSALTASVPMSLNINGAPELSAFSAAYAVPMYGLVGTDPNMVPSQSSASATKLSLWVHIVAEDESLDTDINFFTAWSNGTDGEVVSPTSFLDFTLTGKVGAHVFSGGIALAAFGIEEVGPIQLGPNNLPAMNTVLVYDVPAGATKFWFAPTYGPHGAAQPPSVVPVITVGVVPRAE